MELFNTTTALISETHCSVIASSLFKVTTGFKPGTTFYLSPPHQHPVPLQTSPLRSTVRPSPWMYPGLKVQELTPTLQPCRTVMVSPRPARAQPRALAVWWASHVARSTIHLWSPQTDTVKAHPLLMLTHPQVGYIIRWQNMKSKPILLKLHSVLNKLNLTNICWTLCLIVLSVPCNASRIKAVMDCYTLTAMVEWYPSDGALRYEVVATTASGHNVTCETTAANCELEAMLCGQSYSVSVRAIGETCTSIAHMTEQLVTGNKLVELL